ncbi:MAG: tripartite tricarboxylate transporter substrate binding protein [Fibrobacteria bacterium]|nr:tripartite tricarboxylate transporter substrate binding protein [Fibrobacteria bacterium]
MLNKLAVLVVISVFLLSCNKDKKKRIISQPIKIICAFSAGGGTDQVNRALAEGMKEYLGVQITVQNMIGALGGTAAEYVWKKQPYNGTIIWGLSETVMFLPGNGGHYTTAKDWDYFWACGAPGVVVVKQDSKYNSFQDLLADAKATPGELKVAASVYPGLWSIRWSALEKAAGIKTNILGFTGSNPSLLAVLSGEVDVAHISIGEALPYLQAKKLKPLTMIELDPYDLKDVAVIPSVVDDVPAMKDVLPLPQLIGLAIPAATPLEVKAELKKAFDHAMTSQAIQQVIESQMAIKLALSGEEAKAISAKIESQFNWMLHDLGLAVKNPADLGIPKPE